MKILGVLGGLFMLFVSVRGSAELSVSCTTAWIHVLVGRTPIIDNVPFHAGELYLGYGCPVNVVESNFLGFLYFISFCGIRVQEYPLGIVIETSVTYEPTFADFIIHIPVSCYSQRVGLEKYRLGYSFMRPRPYSLRKMTSP